MDELGNSDKLTTKAVYDYKLVQAALNNGDQKAYAELLHRYRESVYFMMLKMVGNKDDADDLTIEAFGRAFKRLSQYTPNFAVPGYLRSRVITLSIIYVKRNRANLIRWILSM